MNNYFTAQQQPYPYMGYPQPNYYGAGFVAPPQQQIVFNNPLTKEEEQLLKNKAKAFQFQVSELEVAQAICTHKEKGYINVTPIGGDRVKCNICGKEFSLTDGDEAAVQAACNLLVNIIQTLKLYWLNVPTEVARNLYPIIPLIERIPSVYALAMREFESLFKHNNMTEANGAQGFNMLNNIVSGSYGYNPMMNPYYQQPMVQPMPQPMYANPMMNPYYQNMQQPMPQQAPNNVMMPQQPMQAPMYQDPNLGVNPFGYNVPAPAPTGTQQTAAQPQVAQPTQATQPATTTGVPAPAPDAVNDKVFSL